MITFLLLVSGVLSFVTIHTPQENETLGTNVSIIVLLDNFGLAVLSFDGGLTNITMNTSDNRSFIYETNSLKSQRYELSVFGTDRHNNTALMMRNFSVDKTPPFIIVNYPIFSMINNSTVFFEIVSNEYLAEAKYSLNKDMNISFDEVNETTFSKTLYLSDGNHSMDIHIFDNLNNYNTTSLNLSIDTTKPIINSLSLSGDSKSSSPLLNLSGFVSDNHLSEVNFYIGDELFYYNDSGVNGFYSHCYDSIDGDYSWIILAKDLFGNIQQSIVDFSIDIDDPSPIISFDDNISGYYTASFPIVVTVSDSDDIHTVEYRLENDSYNSSYRELDYSEGSLWFGVSDISDFSDGNYIIRIKATNSLGYTSNKTYGGGDIIIDTVSPLVFNFSIFPTLPLLSTVPLGVLAVNISLNTSETEVYYRYVIYNDNLSILLFNESLLSFQTKNFVYSFSSDLNVDGTYNVYIYISDLAGNEIEVLHGEVIIDSTPPVLESLTTIPSSNSSFNFQRDTLLVNFTSAEYPLNVVLFISDENGTIVDSSQKENLTNESFLHFSLPQNLSQEQYHLEIEVSDWLNNSVNASLGNFIMDSFKPNITSLVSNISPIINSSGLVQVNFTSTEFLKLINALFIYKNNSVAHIFSFQNIEAGNVSKNISFPQSLLDTTYTLNMTFIDNANIATRKSLGSFIVDKRNPRMSLNYPIGVVNVSNSAVLFEANFSEELSFLQYTLNDGSMVDILDKVDSSNKLSTDIFLKNYGYNRINLTYKDSTGNKNTYFHDFTALLVISPNATRDDEDGDGIVDTNDTLIGSSQNIYSNYFHELKVAVDNSSNISRVFSGNKNISIYSNNRTLIEFEHNFTNHSLNLTTASFEFYTLNDSYSTFIIRGFELEANKTKTAYFDMPLNSTSTGICIIDEPEVTISSLLNNECNGENMVFITEIPYLNNGYNVSYTSTSNSTVRISGLHHSAIQQLCIEDWSCTSFSSCTSALQNRYCVDRNNCGTEFYKPLETQSCHRSSSGSNKLILKNDTNNTVLTIQSLDVINNTYSKEDRSLGVTQFEVLNDSREYQPEVVLRRNNNSLQEYFLETPQKNMFSCQNILCTNEFIGIFAVSASMVIIVSLFLFFKKKNE